MHILAIDQGTTGTTTVLYDEDGKIVDKAYQEFRQIYPKPGWVEHDPLDIWQNVVETVRELHAPKALTPYPKLMMSLLRRLGNSRIKLIR